MFGVGVGKELGERIKESSENIKISAEKLGNIEEAAKHIKEGLMISSLLIYGAWIICSLLKKL